MKRLFLFLCAGVVSFLTLNAQERLMLEDSVIIGSISRPWLNMYQVPVR